MRIGHGYDVHRFGPGDHVVLGGVRIAHECGVVAHSDGDVLLHALCDALLGACGLGDIGRHFPDTDASYRGIDSRELLRRTYRLVAARGYRLGNADLTLIAQAPRVGAHTAAMCERIAVDLDCGVERVNVKATTTEQLGFIGRGEGLAAYAVVLLEVQA
jgi:2-C-methyl-D-erythritol 2,4-cyclodiphosphate synthase